MRAFGRLVSALAVAAALTGSAVWLIWHVNSSRNAVSLAVVYGADTTVAALLIGLLTTVGGWWWRGLPPRLSTASQVDAAADRLAEVMADRWRREAAARRIITPAPVTVRWRWAADEMTVPRAEAAVLSAAGTGPAPLPGARGGELLGSGVVTRLYQEVYARLPHGRLVLVGGPGAGKSTAMILLLLAALERRASAAAAERARLPVPVWLSLGGWDPGDSGLEQWVTSTMKREYPELRSADYGPDAAAGLFGGGKVALFLDGLDEMPEAAQYQALGRIADEGRGLRLVITSRPGEYQRAVRSDQPDNTAVIELRPVRPAAAAAFLCAGQLEPGRQRWQQLVGYLRSNPGSLAARALDNPLSLSLARDAYAGGDPNVLADPGAFPTTEALRRHLMKQVLVAAYPGEMLQSRAVYWLSWIAYHMGPGRDLPWWGIASWIPAWRLRLLRALATALASGTVAAVAVGVIAASAGFGDRVTAGLWAGLGFGLAFGLIAAFTGKVRFPGAAASARPRRRRFSTVSLVAGSLVGLVNLVLGSPLVLIVVAGTAYGLGIGILSELIFGLIARTHPGISGAPQALVPRWPRRPELARLLGPPRLSWRL